MFSQIGIIVFIPLVLPESGRWLMNKGREDKFLSILKRIAKLNKKQVGKKSYKTDIPAELWVVGIRILKIE